MSSREVLLTGGAPWGFRMHGGTDANQPLRISRRYSDSIERILDVNPGRKAALSSIREGDVISTINGHPTRNMTNSDAHAMLKNSGMSLKLGLNEHNDGTQRRGYPSKLATLELKRPSQLIAEVQSGRSTPQSNFTPTLAAQRCSPSPMRSSPLFLSQSPLSSASLVRSAHGSQFHGSFIPTITPPIYLQNEPTNSSICVYSTLPQSSIYSTVSKLPLPTPNSRYPTCDRSKIMNASLTNAPRIPLTQSDHLPKSPLSNSYYLTPGTDESAASDKNNTVSLCQGIESPNVLKEMITTNSTLTERKETEIQVKRIERIVFNGGIDSVNLAKNWEELKNKTVCNGFVKPQDYIPSTSQSKNPFYQPPQTTQSQDSRSELRNYQNGYYSPGLNSGTGSKPPVVPTCTRAQQEESEHKSTYFC